MGGCFRSPLRKGDVMETTLPLGGENTKEKEKEKRKLKLTCNCTRRKKNTKQILANRPGLRPICSSLFCVFFSHAICFFLLEFLKKSFLKIKKRKKEKKKKKKEKMLVFNF